MPKTTRNSSLRGKNEKKNYAILCLKSFVVKLIECFMCEAWSSPLNTLLEYLCVHELNVIWSRIKKKRKTKKEKKRSSFEECARVLCADKAYFSRIKKGKQRRKDIKIKLNLKTCGKMKIYAHCEEKETQQKNANEEKVFSVKNWILKMHFYHKLHYIRLIDSLFSCASSVLRAKRCFHAIVT